jgi:creatinine amidohydrolase
MTIHSRGKYLFVLVMFALGPFVIANLVAQNADTPSTREMNLINWNEFARFVPDKIQTVLLPVGTLEPHGVIPNGSDNIAPQSMALDISERVNAMIAPTLNYGVTGSMSAFPGAFEISPKAYRLFTSDIIKGLAKNKFKNIIILNGHGGPQTAILKEISEGLSQKYRVRILVINWWSLTSKDIEDVFKENGGHAGNNETAYIQAINPNYVHKELFNKDMATPYPNGSAWSAYPYPSSIGLYEEGQGYPTFNEQQSKEYYQLVNKHVGDFIMEVIRKWNMAGLYR